jgi:putative transposase
MSRSRFTNEQIVAALREVSAGTPAVRVCRSLGVTETTFYRWRKAHGHGSTETHESDEVRALRDENQKLKEIVANLMLDRLK